MAKKWLCNTCLACLKCGKIKFSVANGMKFPNQPSELELYPLEERLSFADTIHATENYQGVLIDFGSQLSLKGSIVNVPTQIDTTVNLFPRRNTSKATVPVQLKKDFIQKVPRTVWYCQEQTPQQLLF